MSRLPRVPSLIVRAGEGEDISMGGVTHAFKLLGEHTGGQLGIEEFRLAPGGLGAAAHVHHAHDEYFYVLSGRMAVVTGAGEVEVGVGDLVQAPRGSVHGFRNASADTEMRGLGLYTPPGYEQYFRDVHALVGEGEPDPAVLARLRAAYDTETL